ncbi:MAG TPA: Cof-type HAD-IIB family hydrolase [Mobilitalea sp.]|nr:Cof-type HAD-IIB family hydrolase [Mobilitalea sp.]
MSYELLFLDMDGTLKQEPDQISEKNKEAIRLACKAGKKVMIASGRNRDLILSTVKELHLDIYGVSYTLALNGAHIIDNITGNTLHSVPISLALTQYLFEKAYKYEITSHVYTENFVYFNYKDFQFDWYQKEGCDCRLVTLEQPGLGLEEMPLKFYLFSKDSKKLELYKQETEKVTEGILNAEFSSKYSLEFTSIHASKGLGMEYVCGLFGLPLASAIAAGDGENDISMLKMAGLGIAMNNALDSVKAVADTITKRTCKEDGVTEIIEEYLMV